MGRTLVTFLVPAPSCCNVRLLRLTEGKRHTTPWPVIEAVIETSRLQLSLFARELCGARVVAAKCVPEAQDPVGWRSPDVPGIAAARARSAEIGSPPPLAGPSPGVVLSS